MKGFTRKIAFVMVLAMLFSMAAPVVGVQAAVQLKYAYQNDPESEVQPAITITVGEKVDMKFVGASSDWQRTFNGWKTDNFRIAQVDINGVVTGVTPGVTQIYADLGAGYTGKLVVIVEYQKEYKIEQITERIIDVDLCDTTLTLEEVQDSLIFKYSIREGYSPVRYPARVTKVKNGVATVELYSYLRHEKTYYVEFKGIEVSFEAHVGEIDFIELREEMPKVYIEDGESTCTITLTPIFRNEYGVDITASAFKTGEETIEYEILRDGSDLAYDAILQYDQETRAAHVTMGRGTLIVNAVYKPGTVSKLGNIVIGAMQAVDVTAERRPPFELGGRLAATVSDTLLDVESKWDNNMEVYAGEDSAYNPNLKLQLLFEDNSKDGKMVSTDLIKGNFRFLSTDMDKLYVARDGGIYINSLNVEKATKIQVLVYYDEEGDKDVDDICDVVELIVRPERKANANMTILSATKLTAYINGLDNGQNEAYLDVQVKDQYGNEIAYEIEDSDIISDTKYMEGVHVPKCEVESTLVTKGRARLKFVANSDSIAKGAKTTDFKYKLVINDETKLITLRVYSAIKGQSKSAAEPEGIPATSTCGYVLDWESASDGIFDCKMIGDYNDITLTGRLYETVNGVRTKELDLHCLNDEDTIIANQKLVNSMLNQINDEDNIDKFFATVTKRNSTEFNSYTDDAGELKLRIVETVEGTSKDVGTSRKKVAYVKDGGIGTYEVNVYKCKVSDSGAATSFATTAVLKKATIAVKDSTPKVMGGNRTSVNTVPEKMAVQTMDEWLTTAVMRCFEFSWDSGEKTLVFNEETDYSSKWANTIIHVEGNGPQMPIKGDAYYINSVTFGIPTGGDAYYGIYDNSETSSNAYNVCTVKVNKYITVN